MGSTTARQLSASSPHSSAGPSTEIVALVSALLASQDREQPAAALAEYVGADNLLIFVNDPDVGAPLPAPGFPKTFPRGGMWRPFLERCLADTRAEATLPMPPDAAMLPALGIAAEDGTIVVLAGEGIQQDRADHLTLLLPLIGVTLRAHRDARNATISARMEQVEAAGMRTLAGTLETARRDLQQALQDARAAVDAREQFLAMASHELKTPITSLSLEMQLLERAIGRGAPSGSGSDMRPLVERTRRQLRRLSSLSDDLLSVTRARKGMLELRREPVDLPALVGEIVQRFDEIAVQANTLIRLDAPSPVFGRWDPHRLDQVVSNLLSNAIRHGQGSAVDVLVAERDGTALLQVRDRGPGIDANDLGRIFEPFERGGAGAASSGIGLGLYIASEIVRLHSGSMAVDSSPGEGAMFTITLPLSGAE